MAEDDVLTFVASSIPSVWALELMLLLQRDPLQGRTLDDLVQELRSSGTAISWAAQQLVNSGLIVENAGTYIYRPASSRLDEFARQTQKLYTVKPLLVMKAIGTARNEALQKFADSFKLKE